MTKKEYDKQYRLANKERDKEYSKQWRLTNSEYFKQYYYNNNSELSQQYHKQHHLNNQLPYHIVYLLPDHNYVGVTNNPTYRMYDHKNQYKRNTDNWIELARYIDRKEALIHEARLHDSGYEGGKVCYNTNGR